MYENPYKKNEYHAKCEHCGKDFIKTCGRHKYCSDCRPLMIKLKKRECAKTWNANNKERRRELARRTYYRNKEKMKAYYARYYQEHKDELNRYHRIYRCSKKYDNCQSCPHDDCIKE